MPYACTGRPVGRPKTKRAQICPTCKRAFMPNHIVTYCSKSCAGIASTDFRLPKNCAYCGVPFVRRDEGKYCSKTCSNLATYKPFHAAGEKHWNWQGGKSDTNEGQRKAYRYKEWQREVFARDNWTCQDCHKKGLEIHAHHVFAFSEFDEHRFDVWNGVTLCRTCHELLHSKERVA